MDIIIDANILFSILIQKGKNEEILFLERMHIFAPEFLFEELNKYKKIILEKTKRNMDDFEEFLIILQKKIEVIPNEETDNCIEEAKIICQDQNDADYFALALKLNCGIWSNDKDLKKQNKIKIYSTEDLIKGFKL